MSSNTTTTNSTDTDDTVMTLFTESFNKDPTLATHFLECLDHLAKSKQVAGFDLEKAWALYDTETLEKRRELVKAQVRKAKKAAVLSEDNFVPVDVKKPAPPREMFRSQFKLKQAKANKEYHEAEFKEAWENISAKDRKALDDERNALLEAYNVERARQLNEQVALGNIPEKRPKNLPNAFFLYKEQVTANPSRYLKPAEVKKFTAEKSTEQTKRLSDNYKAMKENNTTEYQELLKEIQDMTPLHEAEVYEWRVRCAKRLLNRARRLEEDVDKYEAELLNLENNPPEGYKATSKTATDVALPGETEKAVSKAKGKGKGKK